MATRWDTKETADTLVRIVQTRFLVSAPSAPHFPSTGSVEFTFVGRSNVGKSSLLNALCGARIARTSGTPGRTQLVNFFEVQGTGTTWRLVDLPGYGFARAPRSVVAGFEAIVSSYLESERPRDVGLLLVDARRGAQQDDLDVFALLEHHGVQPWVVVTKADKLTKAQRKPTRAAVARAFGVEEASVWMTSTTLKLGIAELRKALVDRAQAWSTARSA